MEKFSIGEVVLRRYSGYGEQSLYRGEITAETKALWKVTMDGGEQISFNKRTLAESGYVCSSWTSVRLIKYDEGAYAKYIKHVKFVNVFNRLRRFLDNQANELTLDQLERIEAITKENEG